MIDHTQLSDERHFEASASVHGGSENYSNSSHPEWSGHSSTSAAPSAGPEPLERQVSVRTTDEQLLDDYRQGQKSSFPALVERYQRELFHFLVRFLGDRATAEDIFQETFLQVHRSAGQFDMHRRFRPWLFTIAANKARDLLRSQALRPSAPLQAPIHGDDDQSTPFIDLITEEHELPGDRLEREEIAKRVRSTVMDMPDGLREILLLSYFDQFPYRQISGILGIPLGTVKSRLHTAVADFANRWKVTNKSN